MTEVAHDANCVFCRVVAGDQPAHEVLRDDVVVAFLDRSPLFVGHTLVVPLGHAETMGDLTPELVGPYYERVRRLSIVMERSLDADGTFIAHNNRVSQSVPHLHAHVILRHTKDGLRGFFWPRVRYDHDDHAADTAATIAAGYAQLFG